MLKQVAKIIAAGVVTAGLGLLLNMTAAYIDPVYVPSVVRWGWFIVLLVFSAYAVRQVPALKNLVISSARGRWLSRTCLVVACLIVVSFMWIGVDGLWNKVGLKPNPPVARDTKPDRKSTEQKTANQYDGKQPADVATKPEPHTDQHGPTIGPDSSPIKQLTELGWTVVATANNPTVINYQEARKPLPDMTSSAHYMKALGGRLNVGIIEASSLAGLSHLADLPNIESLTLAGQFPDLSEVRSFRFLQRLDLVGGSTHDLAPVGGLIQLRELILQQPHETSPDLAPLGALVNLDKLVISGFSFQEVSVLTTMTSLTHLDLSATPVNDLSGLRNLSKFNELTIEQESIPALSALANSPLKILHVRHTDGVKEPIDLAPIASLQHLAGLEIMAAGSLILTPLENLRGLLELTITGTAVSFRDLNYTIHLIDPNAIGELHKLKKLGLAWVDITDTKCLSGLGTLEEVYINQTRSLSDIHVLGTLQKVRSIQLVATSVVDISPLLNLRELRVLTVQATPARLDVITELRNRGVTIK